MRHLIVLSMFACSITWVPVSGQSRPTATPIPGIPLELCDVNGRWTHYAGDAARSSQLNRGPGALNLRWIADTSSGQPVTFVGLSTPVVYQQRVFAYAKHDANFDKIIAFEGKTGAALWETQIDIGIFDSWSTPAIDANNEHVIIGSGQRVHALDIDDGAIAWQRDPGSTSSASAAVSSTLDYNRVYITDSDFVIGGTLYCINVDPFDALNNPYNPGDIVWSQALGFTSGNTPAFYDDGNQASVFVTDAQGFAMAFDAESGSPLWSTDVGGGTQGFFGGIIYANGYVYAATYNFSGGQDNSLLAKIDAASGSIVWTEPCERTDTTPIVVYNGATIDIYVAGGVVGFGSVPKIEAFRDLGSSATKLWDTYQDTSGSLIVGGYTHQPVYANGKLYAGALPLSGGFFDPYTDLYILDTTYTPADPQFVVDQYVGAGSSPAVLRRWVFSFGDAGLHAFRDDCLIKINPL